MLYLTDLLKDNYGFIISLVLYIAFHIVNRILSNYIIYYMYLYQPLPSLFNGELSSGHTSACNFIYIKRINSLTN